MKVKEEIKAFWIYFKGKKRNIGIISLWLLKIITYKFPELIPEQDLNIVREGIDLFLIGGMADAMFRSDKGKEVINKAIEKGKEVISAVKSEK